MDFWKSYETIFIPALSGVSAQIVKFVLYYILHKKINFKRLFEMGGIPSSHTAAVTSLSLVVGLKAGWDSPIFAVTILFSFLVIYDAGGLRRAAGRQASLLNKIVDEIYESGKFSEKKLVELLGHTPVEIILGIIYGIFFTMGIYR